MIPLVLVIALLGLLFPWQVLSVYLVLRLFSYWQGRR